MEQQKTLWIIFSVTLFLLIVVAVGFIWFLPPDVTPLADAETAKQAVTDPTGGYDPIEWVREDEKVPGLEESEGVEGGNEGDDILIVYGESDREVTDTEGTASTEGIKPSPAENVIRVAEPTTPRTSVVVVPRQTAPTPRVATPPTAAVTTPPRNVNVTQYWIQAGAYKSRARAESAQESLSSEGWSARIISRDVDSETFFRVRIGPYDNKGEAEKFLGWIKGIDSFESSYISQVYTSRRVN